MLADLHLSRARRRGVVLVLVLGMLALLALIGVTFATFSNQAQINARNFAQSASFPDAPEVLDFALAQLINDTSNPQSVIRGHGLKRDMYGNDALDNGALLNGIPGTGLPMTITNVAIGSGSFANYLKLTTNIASADPRFYDYTLGNTTRDFFTRWVLRFPSSAASTASPQNFNLGGGALTTFLVSESHEIIFDDTTDTTGPRVFYVFNPFYQPTDNPAPYQVAADTQPNLIKILGFPSPDISNDLTQRYQSALFSSVQSVFPSGIPTGYTFTLDGRFRRAFNGPGMAAYGYDVPPTTTYPARPKAELGNFRYNGALLSNSAYEPALGDPSFIGMDEDYDACDLENWFLAIQSADGQVTIPSFHRPGIISRAVGSTSFPPDESDWNRVYNPFDTTAAKDENHFKAVRAMSRILRPRAVDGHDPTSFPDLHPDPVTGKLRYDVDNDADGTTDSVWLDLGYPVKRNPAGVNYKPLFAFMVVGLNGRLPLNTAGNLHKRTDIVTSAGFPTFDHAEHLGNSPSEVDLRYALQNAYDPTSPSVTFDPFVYNNSWTGAGNPPSSVNANYTQVDNAYQATAGDNPVSVARTQLRNVLTGTRLPDANYDPNVFPSTVPPARQFRRQCRHGQRAARLAPQ